jgi:acetaldehyde dehydrogenase
VYAKVGANFDREAIIGSVEEMVRAVQQYVPGYRMKSQPLFDKDIVTVLLEVEGSGEYLPKYAGNLDIMTSAAVRVAEELVAHRTRTNGHTKH